MTTVNDLLLTTPDLNQERLDALKSLFPDLFTGDGQLNPVELQRLVATQPSPSQERFEFTWTGKDQAKRHAFEASTAALEYDDSRSINPDQADGNIIIEGENLQALKLLLAPYQEQVKCIYIDPPYNTGQDFIYSDNFTKDKKEYWQETGAYENGVPLDSNPETSGRFHSTWLSMLYGRLLLARRLLRSDGVIFVSIDDNEVHNLLKLLDNVFGEENFIGLMVWSGGRKNDSTFISVSHEYIACYVKNIDHLKTQGTTWRLRKKGLEDIYQAHRALAKKHGADYKKIEEGLSEWYSGLPKTHPARQHKHYSRVDEKGVYFPADISWPGGGGPAYEVLHPITKRPCRVPSRGWMFASLTKMQEAIADNRVHFGADETAVPCIKSYLTDKEYEVPYSVFYQDGRAATKRLRLLLGGDFIDHPKDELVIQQYLRQSLTSRTRLWLVNSAESGNLVEEKLK